MTIEGLILLHQFLQQQKSAANNIIKVRSKSSTRR